MDPAWGDSTIELIDFRVRQVLPTRRGSSTGLKVNAKRVLEGRGRVETLLSGFSQGAASPQPRVQQVAGRVSDHNESENGHEDD